MYNVLFDGFPPPCPQHDQALLEEEKQLLEEEKMLLEERVKELTLQIEKYKQQKVRKGDGGRGRREGAGRKRGWREGRKGGRGWREEGRRWTDNQVNAFSTCIAAYMYHNLLPLQRVSVVSEGTMEELDGKQHTAVTSP